MDWLLTLFQIHFALNLHVPNIEEKLIFNNSYKDLLLQRKHILEKTWHPVWQYSVDYIALKRHYPLRLLLWTTKFWYTAIYSVNNVLSSPYSLRNNYQYYVAGLFITLAL